MSDSKPLEPHHELIRARQRLRSAELDKEAFTSTLQGLERKIERLRADLASAEKKMNRDA